jgi:hypothetical protein
LPRSISQKERCGDEAAGQDQATVQPASDLRKAMEHRASADETHAHRRRLLPDVFVEAEIQ